MLNVAVVESLPARVSPGTGDGRSHQVWIEAGRAPEARPVFRETGADLGNLVAESGDRKMRETFTRDGLPAGLRSRISADV